MSTTTETDVHVLIRSLKRRYDLEGAEMEGTTGIDYLEGFVHELGHVLDLGLSIEKAMEVVGDHRAVAKLVGTRKTVRSTDGNEIRATAITVLALSDFPGYKPRDSVSNMYANTLSDDSEATQTRYDRTLTAKRTQRLGARVRRFLAAELAVARLPDAEDVVGVLL